MSAVPRPEPMPHPEVRILTPMRPADVDTVLAIESRVYPFPWSRGNFIDSIAAGYIACLLRRRGQPALLGYCVAMTGAGEMHLLNITVAPGEQRLGHARFMFDDLLERCRAADAARLWLEVRESNAGARAAYGRLGFREEGVRPGYYPAAHGRRESAVVMSRAADRDRGGSDALG